MMNKFAKILGIGSYLPKKVLTNTDLEKMVDTSNEWIVSRTGIHERHIAAKDETPSVMAEHAAKQALKDAKMKATDIELIVVATCTPEKFLPSTACLLQDRLNVGPCMAFDVGAACTGFLYALDVANQYIRAGIVKNALVAGSEILSRVVDWNDRNTCVLFGDGSGAVVLQASDKPGVIGCKLYADGSHKEILDLPSGIYSNPGVITMKGREVFKLAVTGMANAVLELLAEQNLTINDIDWIVPHQANYRIIDLVIEKLQFPREKVVFRMAQHANTSSASIPLAMHSAINDGDIKRGQNILMVAFGGGLTWGAGLFRY